MCGIGGVLLGLGVVEGSSVLALIGQQSTQPGISPAEAANLEFMTHTTRAVVAIFLGAIVLTTCVVLATIRHWIGAYVETRLVQYARRLIGTVKVSIRRLDGALAAHDGLSDGRTEDLMKALQEASSPPLELVAAVRELSAKAGLAIEAAARQRAEVDASLERLAATVNSVGAIVVGIVQQMDGVDKEAEYYMEAVKLGRELEREDARRRGEGGPALA